MCVDDKNNNYTKGLFIVLNHDKLALRSSRTFAQKSRRNQQRTPRSMSATSAATSPRASCSNPKEALREHMSRYHKHADTETAVDAIVEDILETSSKKNECA